MFYHRCCLHECCALVDLLESLKKSLELLFCAKRSGEETEEFLVMKYLVERLTEEEGVMLKGVHEHRPGNQ